ncbi:YceI family protein [Paraconexibacter sp.]|uniref:YceI family protein n=1 Tax=Paraconexibacter sp. TaxID=2949640 RepID=UPI00356AE9CA
MSHLRVGPDHGSITVHTFREGRARRVGHDLVLAVEQWTATVAVDDAGAITALSLDIDARSLRVLEGLGGLKPLSDKDRRDIRGTIDAEVLGGQPITFRCDAVERAGDRMTMPGELTVAGRTRTVAPHVAAGPDGRVSGTIPLVQSDWGIRPYSTMMGALKVRDAVDVVVDVRLPQEA